MWSDACIWWLQQLIKAGLAVSRLWQFRLLMFALCSAIPDCRIPLICLELLVSCLGTFLMSMADMQKLAFCTFPDAQGLIKSHSFYFFFCYLKTPIYKQQTAIRIYTALMHSINFLWQNAFKVYICYLYLYYSVLTASSTLNQQSFDQWMTSTSWLHYGLPTIKCHDTT